MCAGVSEGRDPAAELTEDDPREQKAKHQIEQVRARDADTAPCVCHKMAFWVPRASASPGYDWAPSGATAYMTGGQCNAKW